MEPWDIIYNQSLLVVIHNYWFMEIHRIIKSLRLEKTSKISKSNRQPITTITTKPCPEVAYLHVF